MRRIKLIVFSLLPAAILFAAIEGAAQLYWSYRAAMSMSAIAANGEKVLKNDAINFLKEPDGVLGYRLKPNLNTDNFVSNSRGLAQAEVNDYARAPQSLRLLCIGESTTMGGRTANYPTQLRSLLTSRLSGYLGPVEVINAGVAGWLSDQWALYSERELYKYQPDIVIIYAGWNDFQTYDPHAKPAMESAFARYYGRPLPAVTGLKSVVLARAFLDRAVSRTQRAVGISAGAPLEAIYRFYLENLTRTVSAFRAANPDVRIAISSLAGRWPMDTEEQFQARSGHTGWMEQRGLGRKQAAALLKQFNALIERYARDNGLLFVDMANTFEDLDRQRLMWDFCHMIEDGYRIMAHVFYDRLRGAGLLKGQEDLELKMLLKKYRTAAVVTLRGELV